MVDTVEVPAWLFTENINVTAMRLAAAFWLRGEPCGDDGRVWRGLLTELAPGVPQSSLTTGIANLASVGRLRWEPAPREPGRRGRQGRVWFASLGLVPNLVVNPDVKPINSVVRSNSIEPVKPSHAHAGAESTPTTNSPTLDLLRDSLLFVLAGLGEKHPAKFVERFTLERVAGAVAVLSERLDLAERPGSGVPPVHSELGYLIDRLTTQRRFDVPTDATFLARWLDPNPTDVRTLRAVK